MRFKGLGMAGENCIHIDGELFYTASGAAAYLNIKRGLFYASIRGRIQAYKLGARKSNLYRQSDLEPFRAVYPVAS